MSPYVQLGSHVRSSFAVPATRRLARERRPPVFLALITVILLLGLWTGWASTPHIRAPAGQDPFQYMPH